LINKIENIKPCSDISGMENSKIPAWARDILYLVHAVILHFSMPEDISSVEECNIPVWGRDKVFQHQQSLLPFPELQFSRGELHLKYLL
jgi:hypothetical protein